MGVEITEARAKEREAAEAEASQPGDSEMELDGTINDKDIRLKEITMRCQQLEKENECLQGIQLFQLSIYIIYVIYNVKFKTYRKIITISGSLCKKKYFLGV